MRSTPQRRSIRRKLPLFISALLCAAVGAVSWSAYHQLEGALIIAAGDRVVNVAQRLAGDPGQLEQVLMNLVVNARDAMPEGGRVSIETANVSLSTDFAQRHANVAPGEYVMVAVSDTGAGMPPEIQAHIFEPFFTTKEAGKGTGLGLSTVYGIVKQAGGDISVYSEPGHGTTFKIYFPRLVASSDETEGPVGVRDRDSQGHETVLLVEDDEHLRGLTLRILQSRGYQIITATDGRDALRRAKEHEGAIHLMLSDVVMPGMSGRVLSEQLCALRPMLKVLFMSGYTDDDVMRRGILDRRTAFLEKPFTPEQLVGKVRDVLDGACARAPRRSRVVAKTRSEVEAAGRESSDRFLRPCPKGSGRLTQGRHSLTFYPDIRIVASGE